MIVMGADLLGLRANPHYNLNPQLRPRTDFRDHFALVLPLQICQKTSAWTCFSTAANRG